MDARHLALAACAGLLSLSWLDLRAQVRCTMPNGRVIEQQFAKECPQGATKAETFSGKPAPIVVTPKPAPAPPPPQAVAPAPPPVRQVPRAPTRRADAEGDVQAVISAKCAREWPDDFRMRAYCERKQAEGLSTVRGPVDAPPREAEIIRRKCAGDWPNDFRMRAYCERKQVEGLRQLQR